MTASPDGTGRAAIGPALAAQRPYLYVVGAVAVLRFLVPPGRIPDAQETWLTVAALWLLGLAWIAVANRSARPVGECVGDVGAQNLAIQLLVVVPSVVVGVLRLAVSGGDASGEFPTNAAVTVLFLPLASLVILTLVALPVLWVLLRLRALASVIVTLPVLALVGCNGGTPIDGGEPDPATVEAGRQIYMNNGCANCHGEDGSGRGSISAGFDPPPRDYRDPAAYRVGADAESVAATIGTGLPNPGGGMPSFGHLSPERRLQLAGYIVSLQRSDSTEVAVRYAWIGEPLPGTDVTGAWLTIVNRGAADAVVGVEVKGVRRSSLHVTMDLDGMMTMQGLDRLELPASAEVELASGGTHVMLEKIDVALTVGDMAEVTLFLASKTAVRFEALVRAREGAR